jgi:hypothetical protein
MSKGVQRSKDEYNTQVDENVGGAVPAQSVTDVIEVKAVECTQVLQSVGRSVRRGRWWGLP